ncbi:TPA: ATP-binding protein [Candidatus Ventrenecus stercoripullorum]|nr:ATP-binding protein [Candidatus Ventrenecus stercoripullorum]
MKKYIPRIVDDVLQNKLEYMGAVLIEGCKWCGKSTTARQIAKSYIEFQDPDKKIQYDQINLTKPSLFLEGEKPRLFDEWQMYPVVWDSIRMDIDHTGLKGQYILTGSTKPFEDSVMHTGTGRISRLLMRPMSLFESGESNGLVSLKDIINQKSIEGISYLDFEGLIEAIRRGGWPESLSIDGDNKYKIAKDYVKSLLNDGVRTTDGIERNPQKMNAVLKSISRNISTSVSKTTILDDVKTEFSIGLSRPTLDDYLSALEKLYILEYVFATNLNLRSKTPLRVSPKLELVDPSLAIAILDLKREDLVKDLNFTGFLFENLCMRDLKIYADSIDATLSYYRDKNDFEVDCILKTANGKWGAIEIKLGAGEIEEAAQNLNTFKNKVDTDKYGEPLFLMVLTGAELSYVREDGIYVVSIGTLKD